MERDPRNETLRSSCDVIRIVFTDTPEVVRVDVEPGDTVVLPFDSDAVLQMKTGNGHLGIQDYRDRDHTVILEHFEKAANDALHPVTIERRDGTPIDVAQVLAETDPMLDVECACGSGSDASGLPANTGGIFQVFEGGVTPRAVEAVGPLGAEVPFP